MKKSILIGAIPLIIFMLIIVVVIGQKYSENSNNALPTNEINKNTITDNGEVIDATREVLTVSPDKCRGCGKCVMTDPSHFQMSGRVAVVISQENLLSSTLKNAIYNCPERAISLKS